MTTTAMCLALFSFIATSDSPADVRNDGAFKASVLYLAASKRPGIDAIEAESLSIIKSFDDADAEASSRRISEFVNANRGTCENEVKKAVTYLRSSENKGA